MLIISSFIFIISFIYYVRPILKNDTYFATDEMYWISTAKTVHMLWQIDTKNPLWRDYYGFANLNGAKFIYGIGLALFGHTNVDIVGVAPQTYYKWVSYETGPFPDNHPAYPLLRDARLISAIFMAGVITFVFLLASLLPLSIPASLLAAVITAIHPTSYMIATHVYSDGIFLFFEVWLLYMLLRKLNSDFMVGVLFAYLVSVKLNGLLFGPIIVVLYLYKQYNKNTLNRIIKVVLGASVMFLILHPNFLFYHEYSLLQLIKDRVQITNDHIVYFSKINPSHVTLGLNQRIGSMLKNTFPIWFAVTTIIGFLTFIINITRKKISNNIKIFFLIGFYTTICVMSYTVFDEPRYWFPLLPFMSILAAISLKWYNLQAH